MLYRFGRISDYGFIMYESFRNTFVYKEVYEDGLEDFINNTKDFKNFCVKYLLSRGRKFQFNKNDTLALEYFDSREFRTCYCLIIGIGRENFITVKDGISRHITFKIIGSDDFVTASQIDTVCISPTVKEFRGWIDGFNNITQLYVPDTVEKIYEDSIFLCKSLRQIFISGKTQLALRSGTKGVIRDCNNLSYLQANKDIVNYQKKFSNDNIVFEVV